MRISYDAKIDALYIRIVSGHHQVTTKVVDDDIALDFDEAERLAGIEILDASKRLDLQSLFPIEAIRYTDDQESVSQNHAEPRTSDWDQLRHKLAQLKEEGRPVETLVQRKKNWVEEVSEDYVRVKRAETGNIAKITRDQFEKWPEEKLRRKRIRAITRKFRDMVSSTG